MGGPALRPVQALVPLILSVALAACGTQQPTTDPGGGASSSAGAEAPGTPTTINVAGIRASVCAPILLYQDFLPEQYRINIAYFTAPADQVAQMTQGAMDFACTGLTIATVAQEQGQPINVVANLATRGTAVVVGTESGIESVEDLRGRKVGYFPQSIHDILMRLTLEQAGLDPNEDVELVRINLQEMPAALCRGDVDAFVGNEPNSTVAVIDGCGEVLLYPYDNPVGTVNVGILSTKTLAERDPALVQALVNAHAQAVEVLKADPERWADLASGNWGYDREAALQSFENIELNWEISDEWIANYQALAEQLKEVGLLTTEVDVSNIVNRQFSDAVTLEE